MLLLHPQRYSGLLRPSDFVTLVNMVPSCPWHRHPRAYVNPSKKLFLTTSHQPIFPTPQCLSTAVAWGRQINLSCRVAKKSHVQTQGVRRTWAVHAAYYAKNVFHLLLQLFSLLRLTTKQLTYRQHHHFRLHMRTHRCGKQKFISLLIWFTSWGKSSLQGYAFIIWRPAGKLLSELIPTMTWATA